MRKVPGVALAAATGLAAAALWPAAPAAARAPIGVQDDRLTSGPVEQVPERLRLLSASRAKVTRVDVLWSLVAPRRPARPASPADPAYDFTRLDAVVRGLAERGIVPIVVVYSAPPWAAGGRPIPEGTEVNSRAPSPPQFAAFMRALATRYSGRFRPPGETRALPEVRHWELWNEPNLGAFLSPQRAGGRLVGLQRYLQMVRRAYPVIKRANRDAVVIAGVGGPRSSTGRTGIGAETWARGVARSTAPFDAYSQHVYPSAAPNANTRANRLAFPSWRTLPRLLDILDAVPRRRGTPVYITEAGYTTARTTFRDVRVTPRQQAAYMRQIMRLPIIRNPRIKVVMWFNLQDNANWPGGLRYLGGRQKPSHAAFVRLARASRLPADLRRRGPRVRLSRRQLLINQRISQAAVRRLNLVQRRLDEGLGRDDIRPGGIAPESLGPGVSFEVAPGGLAAAPPPLRRRAETPPTPPRRPGAAAGVRLARGQLLINQRISQAAILRTNGLQGRLDAGLTGGDLREGAVGPAQIRGGVTITGATPQPDPPAATVTRLATADRSGGGGVRLSAEQLLINQRISQAAVRRANALAVALAEGLTSEDFRPAGITARALDPALRS